MVRDTRKKRGHIAFKTSQCSHEMTKRQTLAFDGMEG